TRAVHRIQSAAARVAASMSGVTRPIIQIASAKIPDRNGDENEEKKIAIAATVSTSSHASAIAWNSAGVIATCWYASISIIASANSTTSTLSTRLMPKYFPTTNSQRSIGLLTIAWIVRRWTSL